MKKLVLSVVTLVLCATAAAQVGSLSLHAKGKGLAPSSFSTFYISGDTSTILVEQNASSINARYELVRFDREQKELARVRYRREADRYYVDGFDNAGGVDLLVAEQPSRSELRVLRERRDRQTLEVMGEPTLLHSLKGGKKDLTAFVYRVSPHRQLGAGVYIMQREGEGAEATVKLYSREYEEYWTMTTRLRALDFARVNDSGEVVIGGWGQKKNEDDARFEVTVLDGERDHTHTFTVSEGTLTEVQLANYADGKVYLFALVRQQKNNGNGSQVDRLLSICYNTASEQLKTDVHELTADEINRLYNRDDGSRAQHSVQFLQIDGVSAAPDGHYDAVLSQRWTEVDRQGLPNGYFTQGLTLVTVDREGNIARLHSRRMNTGVPINQRPMNYLQPMRTAHGTVLFYTEHAGSCDRPLSESIKRYQPILMSGVLTVVYLPDQGEPQVQHVEIPKYGIFGVPKRIDDGSFMLFLRNLGKAQVGVFRMNPGL